MDFHKEIEQSKALEAKALDDCNREPIQTPGLIQNYGALIAFDFQSLVITHASENIGDYIDFDGDTIFDRSIRSVFSKEDYHAIANIASHKATFFNREQVAVFVLKGQEITVSLYRSGESVVFELIPVGEPNSAAQVHAHLKWTLDTIKKSKTVDQILKQSVHALKNIIGYDRVMAYRFHPDNSGEVVAEFNSGKMESYLGLRFPASDIPPIARDIFLKIGIRYIGNTSNSGHKIQAANKNIPPLNLTLGILRGNSPIHNQYLRNMQVVSTLTLPIVVKGKLWGLFAMHNREEKVISSDIHYSAELIGQLISMVLEQRIITNADEKIKKLRLEGEGFVTLNKNELYLQTFWKNYAQKLSKLIACDGVAYQIDENVLFHGNCPSEKTVKAINAKLQAYTDGELHHFTNLDVLEVPDLGAAKGLLALKVNSGSPVIFIYFFRNEIEHNITWAGNPKKDIVVEEAGVRLHPRSSFNHFTEINKGYSELWDSETLDLAEAAIETFKRAAKVEKATAERFNRVVQELNHRLRNILTLVRSISRQTAQEGSSVETYVNSLEHRILALANANSLLTTSSYNSVDFKTLLMKVIPPLCDDATSIVLLGPDTKLASDIIPTIVLIIHELTTNAVKYGSLSVKEGRLNVSWQIDSDGLHLEWKESGGPLVTPPVKRGFGSSVIENAIAYEFSGTSRVEYKEDGLYAAFRVPKSMLGDNKGNIFVLEQIKEAVVLDTTKKYANILILEDDYINASEMKRIISSTQVDTVETFSNQNEAIASLNTIRYDLALLDVNLKNETCINVALECSRKNIPFYYITGYGASFLKENTFPEAPVILKPIHAKELKEIMNQHIKKEHGGPNT